MNPAADTLTYWAPLLTVIIILIVWGVLMATVDALADRVAARRDRRRTAELFTTVEGIRRELDADDRRDRHAVEVDATTTDRTATQ